MMVGGFIPFFNVDNCENLSLVQSIDSPHKFYGSVSVLCSVGKVVTNFICFVDYRPGVFNGCIYTGSCGGEDL